LGFDELAADEGGGMSPALHGFGDFNILGVDAGDELRGIAAGNSEALLQGLIAHEEELGDPHRAGTPPTEHWMLADSTWASSRSYLKVASNYVFLHENLLDLSHLTFLHASTFGTPDYALAPYETHIGADVIEVKRAVQPTRLPPIYAEPLGLTGVDAARIVTSTYKTPGLSISAVLLRDLTKSEATRVDHHIRTAQLVTPCDRDHVHYHFVVSRDFATGSEDVTDFIQKSILAAFAEDVFALESIAKTRELDSDPNFREFSVASDRAGVTLRRWLLKRALAEQEPPVREPASA